jgi:site-specific DNA-methyltransferase (adenine-specific)
VKVESVAVDVLSFDAQNARKHSDKNLGAIQGSLEQFGQRKPIVVTAENVVVAGNGTLQAALNLGWKKIDVVRVPVEWSADQVKAFALADNRTSELAEWNPEVLSAQLLELSEGGMDVEALGFDVPKPLEPEIVEDVVGAPPSNPITKLGDVWQVGDHRIVCGSATDAAAYEKLLGQTRVDFVFTDPPYGVDIQERDLAQAEVRGRRKDGKGVMNDNLSAESLGQLLDDAFALAVAQCRPGAAWYVCSPPGDLMAVFGNSLNRLNIGRHSMAWVKNSLVMGRADYHYRHEVIFYGWVPGAGHSWYSDRKQDSVWEFDRPSRSPEHPTMKPVELVAYAMGNSSKAGDSVLDPFCGSGTTLVAAAQTGRVGYGIELDPSYVDVIVLRLETLTGQKAVLENASG